ncbi:MAG TPA: hypothetical protein VGC53_03280 [Vicinamibacteria bacterium]
MLGKTRSHRFFRLVGLSALLAWTLLVPEDAKAQGEEIEQRYSAFGVAMGAGASGVLNITITRWSTAEERALLINSLIENGQEKTVELLRDQKETGWARTQMGRGMGGTPSSRLHYAYEFNEEGKRTVVLVTDRTMRIGEVARGTRSSEYDVSAIVMELTQEGDKEKGQGVFYPAVKFGFNKEKNTLEIEYLGTQPIRLTSIDRDK